MPEIHAVEWNALINRARATLEAQRRCDEPTRGAAACRRCGLAASPAHCRQRFRATEQRLARLVRRAAAPQRHQLRRTVDGLLLAYRAIRAEAEGGG